jgi:hypothetical protein
MFGHGCPDLDCGLPDCGGGVDFDCVLPDGGGVVDCDVAGGRALVVGAVWAGAVVLPEPEPELGAAAAPAMPAAAPPAASAPTTTAALSVLDAFMRTSWSMACTTIMRGVAQRGHTPRVGVV